MKKVFYLFVCLLSLLACDKNDGEIDLTDINKQEKPSYMAWQKVYLHLYDNNNRKLPVLYYNADSLVFTYTIDFDKRSNDYADMFSTHDNIFAGYDPLNMNDSDVLRLAGIFYDEIQREKDIKKWIDCLYMLEEHNAHISLNSHEDYGLLWGLKPTSYRINTDTYIMNIEFTEDNKKGYYFRYAYDMNGGSIGVYKCTQKGSGYSELIGTIK